MKYLLPVILSAVLVSTVAQAQFTKTISYQGAIGNSGAPLVDSTYLLRFTFYDSLTGGSELWREVQPVPITKGFFTAYLGAVTPFQADLNFSKQYYLGTALVGDSDPSDFVPRAPLSSSPYALHALIADSVLTSSLPTVFVESINGAHGKVLLEGEAITVLPTGNTIRLIADIGAITGKEGIYITNPSGPSVIIKIDTLGVTTGKLANESVTSEKIANNSVVRYLNGLRDGIRLVGGTNTTIVTSGDSIQINATGGGTSGNAGGDLTGTYPDPLLKPSGVTPNTYGTTTSVPQITVDPKGRITNASNLTITGTQPGGPATGDLTGNYPNPNLASSGVTSGSYGSSTQVPLITVDTKGRITNASSLTISGTQPGGAATGDLTGFYPSPTIATGKVVKALTVGATSLRDNVKLASTNSFLSIATSNDSITFTLNGAITSYSDSARIANRSNIADSSRIAKTSVTADSARISGRSVFSDSARVAFKADTARVAFKADSSFKAFKSDTARTAFKADSSFKAFKADSSFKAFKSDTARASFKADSAFKAFKSDTARTAFKADSSIKSDSARISFKADTARAAFKADSAFKAFKSDTAQTAFKADSAFKAFKADTARAAFKADSALTVKDGAITNAKIAAGAVDSAKIANGTVVRRINNLRDSVKIVSMSPSLTVATSNDSIKLSLSLGGGVDTAQFAFRSDTARTAFKADSSFKAFKSDTTRAAFKADSAFKAFKSDTARAAFKADSSFKAFKSDTARAAFKADSAFKAFKSDTTRAAFKADTARIAFKADSAVKSDSSRAAFKADSSFKAFKSDTARAAFKADSAVKSDSSRAAFKADSAFKAFKSDTARTAFKADSSFKAFKSDTARTAFKADSAFKAFKSDTARTAFRADSAVKSDSSRAAFKADSAFKAFKADTARTAFKADSAFKSDTARTAFKADSAFKAFKADSAFRAFKSDTTRAAFKADSAITIKDAAVTNAKLAANAVDSNKILFQSVSSSNLSTTGVVRGTYGDSTHVGQFTVDTNGRITSATNKTITGAAPTGAAGGDLSGLYPNPQVTGLQNSLLPVFIANGFLKRNATATAWEEVPYGTTANTVMQGNQAAGGTDLTGTYPNPTLTTTGVVAGAYTTANITVDAKGRILSASTGTGVAPPPDYKESARLATTGNITLTGLQSIDGVTTNANDRVLVKNQTTAAQNGIYIASALAWTRATDANTATLVTPGLTTYIEEGTTNTKTRWNLITTGTIVPDVTSLSFALQTATPIGAAGGDLTGTYPNPAIANNAVTYAKMQSVSTTSKLLGSSSTTTPVQEISLGSGLSLSGTTLSATGTGGTVTSFSAGTLSPLFTTSVATATTTPALSFTLSNAAANTIFGNNTGSSAAPAYFTPTLASSLFANQGTTTTVLHGNAAGNPVFGQIVNADITNSTIDLTTKVTGILPVANGGTGSSTQNFVDLTTTQAAIGGAKTFTGALTASNSLTSTGTININNTGGGTTNIGTTGTAGITVAVRGKTSFAEDMNVNTNKFTVASATGNTTVGGTLGVAGDFAVNTSKFTVASATGNTVVAGTLGLAGSTSGTVTIQPQAAAGTYNFNLPTSAGTSGQPLLSGGGAATGNELRNIRCRRRRNGNYFRNIGRHSRFHSGRNNCFFGGAYGECYRHWRRRRRNPINTCSRHCESTRRHELRCNSE